MIEKQLFHCLINYNGYVIVDYIFHCGAYVISLSVQLSGDLVSCIYLKKLISQNPEYICVIVEYKL